MPNEVWKEGKYYYVYVEDRKLMNQISSWQGVILVNEACNNTGAPYGWTLRLPDMNIANRAARLLGLPQFPKNTNRVEAGKKSGLKYKGNLTKSDFKVLTTRFPMPFYRGQF